MTHRTNRMLMRLPKAMITQELLDRFAKFVEVDQDTGCHIWTGGTLGKYGHGRFSISIDGKQWSITAHRAAMLLAGHVFTRKAPLALHRCPELNRKCVCLEHLYAGNAKDNGHDMVLDGTCWHGAKLQPADIPVIRTRLAHGEHPCTIAEFFGVVPGAIYNIRSGLAWTAV